MEISLDTAKHRAIQGGGHGIRVGRGEQKSSSKKTKELRKIFDKVTNALQEKKKDLQKGRNKLQPVKRQLVGSQSLATPTKKLQRGWLTIKAKREAKENGDAIAKTR